MTPTTLISSCVEDAQILGCRGHAQDEDKGGTTVVIGNLRILDTMSTVGTMSTMSTMRILDTMSTRAGYIGCNDYRGRGFRGAIRPLYGPTPIIDNLRLIGVADTDDADGIDSVFYVDVIDDTDVIDGVFYVDVIDGVFYVDSIDVSRGG